MGCERLTYKKNKTPLKVAYSKTPFFINIGDSKKQGSPKKCLSAYKYKYNGKELQEEFGLNWYDYGARNYMDDLGRWTTIDPLAGKYKDLSPFAFAANNPILYLDPDGNQIIVGANTKDALTKLAQLAATRSGSRILNKLVGVKTNYFLNKVFWSSNSSFDSNRRNINYPSSVWRFGIDGGNPGSTFVLGHEIKHAFNHANGRFQNNRKDNESSAVNFGNYLRSVYGKEDLRTSYNGLGLKFSDKDKTYNPDNEKVNNFTQTLDIKVGTATVLGFSFDTSEDGEESSTGYVISIKTKTGSFAFRRFDNKKGYDDAVKRLRDAQKKENENDKN